MSPDLAGVFAEAGARGWLHAVRLGDGQDEVGLDPDEPVAMASVYKLPLAVTWAGLVAAGEALCDRHRRWTATVLPDGRIQCGTARGSIHAVGAAVQEAPSCNGWTFWHHVGRDGALKLLDNFRQEITAA